MDTIKRKVHLEIPICLFLALSTLAVYWQTYNYDFVYFDDQVYVAENYAVQAGMSKHGLHWALTTFEGGNWHPLTWLSHMLDVELFGLNAGMHHVTNLLFHIANSILVFFLFRRMTGAMWRSAFVASIFAIHPLHVESVAWIAERKDVLCTFFWMLTMLAYVHYTKKNGLGAYILVIVFFMLGLMSKPMIVTLPLILLFLDYWPLGRLRFRGTVNCSYLNIKQRTVSFLLVEKIPLFVLSALVSLLTLVAQNKAGFVQTIRDLSLPARIVNAVISYVAYMGKMFWPSDLAVLYPYPESFHFWNFIGAASVLISISTLCFLMIRGRCYLAVGWLWYVVSLLPMIGVIQVGEQAMADRYTYIPSIGISVAVAWLISDALKRWSLKSILLTIGSCVIICAFALLAWKQVGYWKNTLTLFKHTLNVTEHNWSIQRGMGLFLINQGKYQEGTDHIKSVLKVYPEDIDAHMNLGVANERQGLPDEAIKQYEEVLRIDPNYFRAHNNLGNLYASKGKIKRAMAHYNEALRIDPNYAAAHVNMGNLLAQTGSTDEAIRHYSQALNIAPFDIRTRINMGIVMLRMGRYDEAISTFSKALSIDPNSVYATYGLGRAYHLKGENKKAIMYYTKALKRSPENEKIRSELQSVLKSVSDKKEKRNSKK